MTVRLDPRQLDRAWDAAVLGEPFAVADQDERVLFGMLETLSQPAPPVSFVRSLERSLALKPSPDTASIAPATTPALPVRTMGPGKRRWQRPPSRRMTAGYAFAAIALVILLSTVAISRQQSGLDDGAAIPAVSQWNGDGPPTSPGVETTTLFSHAFSADELAPYALDQWGWVQMMHGTVEPGQRSSISNGEQVANTMHSPGISFIEIERGQLSASLAKPALVGDRSFDNQLTEVPAGMDVTLETGETLVFGLGTLSQLWNPTDAEASYVAGGLYTQTDFPITFAGSVPQDVHSGISFDASILAGVGALSVSFDQVSIGPGETFAYAVTPQTLLLAEVTGNGLVKQRWTGGIPSGKSQPLMTSIYSLHQAGDGYYTLTNTGAQPVDVYLMKVAPPTGARPTPNENSVSVKTLFSQTLDQADLAAYQRDGWNWISMTEGTMPPGSQAVIVEGSPEAGDIGFNGLGAVSVTSGTLVANAAQGAMVERGATGAIEPIDRSADVTIEAGDTLIVPANTLPAIWNRSDTDASYVTGGVYTTDNITPLNEMDFDFTRGGIQTDADDLAAGAPVTMSLEQVSIPPGASYSYSVSSETWLEAIVNGELRQEKRIDGVLQGKPKLLVALVHSLHSDGFGEYTLTNDGEETVEISFFRVETSMTPNEAATPAASTDARADMRSSRTFDQTELTQLQSNDWGWMGITRETIAPGQGPLTLAGSSDANTSGATGLTMIAVEQGTLSASVDAGAWVQDSSGATTEPIEGLTTVTLHAGDTLFAPPPSVLSVGNSGDSDAMYLQGTVYTSIYSGLAMSNPNVHEAQGSAIVNGHLLAIGTPLTMTLEHAVIEPGATYSYAISSETWLMALADGDGLQWQKEIQGAAQGSPQPLPAGSHALHEEGFGDYTLTNTGTEAVELSLYRIEPAAQPSTEVSPTTQIDTLFDQTWTPEQLQAFRLSDWRWVSFARNTIPSRGDTEAFTALRAAGTNMVPGINMMVIESGSLTVMPEAEVLVARGVNGVLQSSPAGMEIVLAPGDALLYQRGAEGHFWNPTGQDAVVVGGGGYIRPSAPAFSGAIRDMDNNRPAAGQISQGISVTPGDMPDGGPVSVAIERITIAPGGSTTIGMDSAHWAIAVVVQGDLQQVRLVDGQPTGTAVPVTLRELVLQPGEDQAALLTNVGSDSAVIYVMRIAPSDSQAGNASPTAD